MALRPTWRGYPNSSTDYRQTPEVYAANHAPFSHVDPMATRQREEAWRDGLYNNAEDQFKNKSLYPRPPTLLANNSKVYVHPHGPTAPYPYM
jgi:hypothetical protein